MPPETLTAPTPAPSTAPSQPDAAAPVASRADEPRRGSEGNTPEGQAGAARKPEDHRQARLEAARQVRLQRSGGSDDGRPQGQAASRDAQGGNSADPRGTAPKPAAPAAPNAGEGEGDPAAALKYGAHTAKDRGELEKLMRAGQKARLEMGALGEKIAQGQPLTTAEVEQLLAHFDQRNAGINAKLAELRAGKAPANGPATPGQQNGASKQQPQNKTGGRGQTPAGDSTSGSPDTDALDEGALLELDDDAAENIRSAWRARGQRLSETEARLAAANTQLQDLNFAMAVGAYAHSRPDLLAKVTDPKVQDAILTTLESWNVTADEFAAGGPEFLRKVQEAATLVLLPSAPQAHADLLARSAAEMAGSPQRPLTGRQSANTPATLSRTQARLEVARVTSDTTLTPQERETRLQAIRQAYQAGQAAAETAKR